MKVLSADDSVMIRKVIKNAVAVLGFEFLEAKDGQEALDVMEKEYADVGLVLLDWNMPRLNGLEVLKKLQADERFKAIPVMMVTTEIERAKVLQALAAGAKNYVMKPFSHEDLIAKIMQSIGMGV
ncbi:MAG: response regulator [Chitinivibrionales bacterium]|nr:response regulator [Chitinivibrionales bacterium]